VRPLPPSLRYLRWVAGFIVLAAVGIAAGVLAAAHHISGLSHLAAIVTGLAFGLAIGMTARAYILGVRIPSHARQLAAMAQAVDDQQPVSGRFWAGLRDVVPRNQEDRPNDLLPVPGQPPRLARWMSGRVVITPGSVLWVRGITGRKRDLTGAECTGERHPDPGYREMTLTVPSSYKGEALRVITLHADGTDVELITQAQLLEVLRSSLARTSRTRGSSASLPAGSGDSS
jgi:hypothetical protein